MRDRDEGEDNKKSSPDQGRPECPTQAFACRPPAAEMIRARIGQLRREIEQLEALHPIAVACEGTRAHDALFDLVARGTR